MCYVFPVVELSLPDPGSPMNRLTNSCNIFYYSSCIASQPERPTTTPSWHKTHAQPSPFSSSAPPYTDYCIV